VVWISLEIKEISAH